MPNEESSLEEAPEAVSSESPHDDAEPSASGKSDDGAETQDNAESSTTTPAAEPEPSLTAELTGEASEPAETETPETDEAKSEPQEDPEQKTPEKAQPEKDQKPADDDAKPLSAEQERSTPKFARRRIKNLEAKLEAATASVRELEARAIGAGYEKAEEVLDAVETFGRAIKKRDPEAIAKLERHLADAGWKRPEAVQTGIPAEKVRQLLQAYAYDELEKLASEAAQAPAPAKQDPPKQSAPNPPAPPEKREQQKQPDPERLAAVGALQALADEVRKQHGEAAQEILADIAAEVAKADAMLIEKVGVGMKPSKWADEFRAARDAVIARRRDQAKRTPPKSLRSSSSAETRRSGTSLMDEILS